MFTKQSLILFQLRIFSFQLLHRKVQFTACGFFPLDFTLLYSVRTSYNFSFFVTKHSLITDGNALVDLHNITAVFEFHCNLSKDS